MKKSISRLILFVTVMLMLVPVLTGCGKNMDETIAIEVMSYTEAKNGAEIVLSSRNETGHNVSLGWVNSCQVEVTTSEDTYYYEPHMDEFSRGKDTLKIYLRNCEGDLEKVVITELCLLNNQGLPGKRMHDVVVFDASEDIDGFEDAFGITLSMTGIVFIIVPVLMVAIVAAVVVVAVHTRKKNREAARQFHPFNAADPGDGAQQMHEQAMQMHEQAHRQFVNQEQMRIHNEFAHQSVTPTDQGGFVPPPPPPPMGM